jgi:hypothetical protein
MGRWDYRKSTKEIIETFLKTFSVDEPVDLVVSIDNMWGEEMDGFKTTEERLQNYNLTDPRIKIIHFLSREDYIKYLKTGHVFVSCARSEGWNLPLLKQWLVVPHPYILNVVLKWSLQKEKVYPLK